MENIYEFEFKVNDEIGVRYIRTDLISNVFINTNEKNLLTKSAKEMTFKGLLNLIAFYTFTDNYAIDDDGVVMYGGNIVIDDHLYLQLESNEFDFELIDDDFDNLIDIGLYYRVNQNTDEDIIISSYQIDESVYEFFEELREFKLNEEFYKDAVFVDSQYIEDKPTI